MKSSRGDRFPGWATIGRNPRRTPWKAAVRMHDPRRIERRTFRLVKTTSTISVSSHGVTQSPQHEDEREDGKGDRPDEELRNAGKPQPRDGRLEHPDDPREREHPGEEDPRVGQLDPGAQRRRQADDQDAEHPEPERRSELDERQVRPGMIEDHYLVDHR